MISMTTFIGSGVPPGNHRPGTREKAFFFLSGVVVSVPMTIFVESFSGYALLSALLIAPIVEEFAKAYPLFYRHGETERSIFTLGFLVGLGFGISEFFMYVLVYGAPIALRLPALLFHATNASIVAYGITKKRTLSFYLIAVSLHFSNNLFAGLGQVWFVGAIAATAGSYLLSWRLWRRTSERVFDFD